MKTMKPYGFKKLIISSIFMALVVIKDIFSIVLLISILEQFTNMTIIILNGILVIGVTIFDIYMTVIGFIGATNLNYAVKCSDAAIIKMVLLAIVFIRNIFNGGFTPISILPLLISAIFAYFYLSGAKDNIETLSHYKRMSKEEQLAAGIKLY